MNPFNFTTHDEILTDRVDDVNILEMYKRTCTRLRLLRMQYNALEQAHYALRQEFERVAATNEKSRCQYQKTY